LKATTAGQGGHYGTGMSSGAGEAIPRTLRVMLSATDHSVRLARRATRVVLTAWRLAHVEESAVLIVSELATNAVRHARGLDVITVDLLAAPTWLRIECQDTDRDWPQPRVPAGFDESGLGFVLVDALAGQWGVRETETGKAVWAELDTRPGAGPGI